MGFRHRRYAGTEICVNGELTERAGACDVCEEAVVHWNCDSCYHSEAVHSLYDDGPAYPQLKCDNCNATVAEVEQREREEKEWSLARDIEQAAEQYSISADEARAVHMGQMEELTIKFALDAPPRIAKKGPSVPRPVGAPVSSPSGTDSPPVWRGLLPLLREKAKIMLLINLRLDFALPGELVWKVIAHFECPKVPFSHTDSLMWRRMYNTCVRNVDCESDDQDRPVPLGAGRCVHVDTVREHYEDCHGGWPTRPAPFWCVADGMLDYAGFRVFLWCVRHVRYPGSIAAGMPVDHCPTGWREHPDEWFASDIYQQFLAQR